MSSDIKNQRKFLSRKRELIIIAVLTFYLGGLGASINSAQATEAPKPILSDQRCPVCGMYPARYPKWQTQIIFTDGQSTAFDGGKDLFRFLLSPEKYLPDRTIKDVQSVLVHDFETGDWIDGKQAFFVVGSKKTGPMGKEIIPFAKQQKAQAFIAAHGGLLARYGDINQKMLHSLEQNKHGKHGHHDAKHKHGNKPDQPAQHRHHKSHQYHGGRTPVGVMGDHTMDAGDWMLSYRFMRMDMDGNRDGNNSISTAAVLADFMVTPLEMTMDMHMLGLMYAPTNKLTLMAMVPYLDIEMDHVTRMGARFTTKASGLGDIKVGGLYSLYASPRHNIHLNAGLSLPTGDIDRRDDTPASPNQKLPYPMQLGSGTYDLMPGLTYSGHTGIWSWGSQAIATFRLGDNSNEYTLGDRFDLTGWVGRQLGNSLNLTVRLHGQTWSNIDGADPDLNPMMVPTADPNKRGGTRLDLLGGLNYIFPTGPFAGSRLSVEGGAPVYQYLDGPQLETDWLITAGWTFVL